jgi:3-methylcrotonyl-CoA carboxylase beta subunit
MCGRAFDGRFLFSWPNHRIAVMGGEQAANTLAEVKLRQLARAGQKADEAMLGRVREETLKAYEEQTSAYYSTSELWDDGILDPVDTRNALGVALSAALNAPFGTPGNGVFRF